MGPRETEDEVTPHTRPPADDDADHLLVRTVRCLEGTVEIDLVCEPAFDYGRTPAEWTLVDGESACRRRDRRGPDHPAADRPRARRGGQPGPGPARAVGRRGVLLRPVVGRGTGRAGRRRRGQRAAWTPPRGSGAPGWDGRGCPTTAGATRSSARPWPSRASPTCRPGPPWRRSRRRCPRRPAASGTGTTATPGCATPPSRLQALHFLNLDWEADEFMQFVADLEPTETGALQIMYGIDGRRDLTESTRDDLSGYAGARPVRIGNGAFDQRQNDVFGAVLDSILLHTRRSQRLPRRLWPIVQSQARVRHRGVARTRPGHLGGPRQAPALRVLQADGLGRPGPCVEAGRDPRRR